MTAPWVLCSALIPADVSGTNGERRCSRGAIVYEWDCDRWSRVRLALCESHDSVVLARFGPADRVHRPDGGP